MYRLFLSAAAIVAFPLHASAGHISGWGDEGWGPAITFGRGTAGMTMVWILVLCFAYATAYLFYRLTVSRGT